MKVSTIVSVMLAGGLIIACGSKDKVVKGEISQKIEGESIHSSYVETIGIGAADQTMENTTQRKATSRNAAIVQAQYELLSIIKGVELEGGIIVEKAMETDSRLATSINQLIKGAEVIKTEWTADDGCVVTVRINKKRLKEIDPRFKL